RTFTSEPEDIVDRSRTSHSPSGNSPSTLDLLFDEEALDLAQKPGEVDGLGVIVVAAGLQRPFAVPGHGVGSQGQDRNGLGPLVGLDTARSLPPAQDRQAHV